MADHVARLDMLGPITIDFVHVAVLTLVPWIVARLDLQATVLIVRSFARVYARVVKTTEAIVWPIGVITVMVTLLIVVALAVIAIVAAIVAIVVTVNWTAYVADFWRVVLVPIAVSAPVTTPIATANIDIGSGGIGVDGVTASGVAAMGVPANCSVTTDSRLVVGITHINVVVVVNVDVI